MKAYKLTYPRTHAPNPFLIKGLLRALLLLALLNGCGGSSSHVAENPASQRFHNVTRKWLLPKSFSPKQVVFLRADQNPYPDLMVLCESKSGESKLRGFFNQGGNNFLQKDLGQWTDQMKGLILSFTAIDLNRDGGDDLALVIQASGKVFTQILFNNKKGYFYAKDNVSSFPLSSGVDKVVAEDIDQDGDKDLFYFGQRVLGPAAWERRDCFGAAEGNRLG